MASCSEKELKSITINTMAYTVPPKTVDKRSESITAEEDMHIVAIEHFIGVSGGGYPTDNGHILSKNPDNPWVKWGEKGTGMEPTGEKGYFGYCGRDYYSEVSGVNDVCVYEGLPSGYFLVKKGEKLYMHCYADNPTDKHVVFHHCVRLIYW
jgi:hypothetical protein